MKKYYTYDEMCSLTRNVAQKIEEQQNVPDIVVGLTRGGLFPAVVLSHRWDIPMISLNVSTRDFPSHEYSSQLGSALKEGKKVLVVDDVCDTGETFRLLKNNAFDFRHLPQITFATVFRKPQCDFELHCYGEEVGNDIWIVFPWEITDAISS